jgi:hypothetical protein
MATQINLAAVFPLISEQGKKGQNYKVKNLVSNVFIYTLYEVMNVSGLYNLVLILVFVDDSNLYCSATNVFLLDSHVQSLRNKS